jgi:hypothetical protein
MREYMDMKRVLYCTVLQKPNVNQSKPNQTTWKKEEKPSRTPGGSKHQLTSLQVFFWFCFVLSFSLKQQKCTVYRTVYTNYFLSQKKGRMDIAERYCILTDSPGS